MPFNTSLADQLEAAKQKLVLRPHETKPRCMCHNKFLTDCPNQTVNQPRGKKTFKVK